MNLIEAIQEKCNYIREEIIPAYDRIGAAGTFGKMMLQQDIMRGEQAIANDDPVEMMAVYKHLEETCRRAL